MKEYEQNIEDEDLEISPCQCAQKLIQRQDIFYYLFSHNLNPSQMVFLSVSDDGEWNQ